MPAWLKEGNLKTNDGGTTDRWHYDESFLKNPNAHADSGPGPEPPRDSPEWPAWKAHAKAWRRSIGQRQADVDMQLAMGADLENDLGIVNVHEMGQAGWNRRRRMGDEGMGGANGWEYDWGSGRKRNMVTSDKTARDRWLPIRPEEYKEREYAQSYGGGVKGYQNRLQSEQKNRFGNVMREGGPGNGIKQNEFGIYEDVRPDGSTTYYDEYGAKTDRSGNRTGGSYHYDGKGQNIVNRVASEGDTYGHAAEGGTVANPTFGQYSWGANRSYGGAWGGQVQPATPAQPAAPAAPGAAKPTQYSGNTGSQPQAAIPGYNAPVPQPQTGGGFMSGQRRQAVNSSQYRPSIPGLNQTQSNIPGL